MKLIDKNELLEKLKKLKQNLSASPIVVIEDVKSLVESLKTKEVDLEKEYEEFVVDDPILGNFITNDTMGMVLAKHFFELGLKTQKGE